MGRGAVGCCYQRWAVFLLLRRTAERRLCGSGRRIGRGMQQPWVLPKAAYDAMRGAQQYAIWMRHLEQLMAECIDVKWNSSDVLMIMQRFSTTLNLLFSVQPDGLVTVSMAWETPSQRMEALSQRMEPPDGVQIYWDLRTISVMLEKPCWIGSNWAGLTGADLWEKVDGYEGHVIDAALVQDLLAGALRASPTPDQIDTCALPAMAHALKEMLVQAGEAAALRCYAFRVHLAGDAAPSTLLCIWDLDRTHMVTLLLGSAARRTAAFLDPEATRGRLCMYYHYRDGNSIQHKGAMLFPDGHWEPSPLDDLPALDNLGALTQQSISGMGTAPVQLPAAMSLGGMWVWKQVQHMQLFSPHGVKQIHAVGLAQLSEVLARVMRIGNSQVLAQQLLGMMAPPGSLLSCSALSVNLAGAPATLLCLWSRPCTGDGTGPVVVAVSPDAWGRAWPFCADSAAPAGCMGVYFFQSGYFWRKLCGLAGGPKDLLPEPPEVAVKVALWEPHAHSRLFAEVQGKGGGSPVQPESLHRLLPMVGLPAEQAIAGHILACLQPPKKTKELAYHLLVCELTGARIMCVAGEKGRVLLAQYGALQTAMPMVTGVSARLHLGIKEDELKRTMAMVVQSAAGTSAPTLVVFSEGAEPRSCPFNAALRRTQLAGTVGELQQLLTTLEAPGALAVDTDAEARTLLVATLADVRRLRDTIHALLKEGDVANYINMVAAEEEAAIRVERAAKRDALQCIRFGIRALGVLQRSLEFE